MSPEIEPNKIELNVKLTPEEAIHRIYSVMDKDRLFSIFRYTGDNQLIGKIEGYSFHIRKKTDSANSWRPILSGTVEATQVGCRIQAEFGTAPIIRLFTIIWLGMFVFFVAIGSMMVYTSLIAGTFEFKILLLILVPLCMLIFSVCLRYVCKKTGNSEKEYVRKVFLELFDNVST